MTNKKVEDTHMDVDTAKKLQSFAIGVTLGVYLWNTIDAFFTKPEIEINTQRFLFDINLFFSRNIIYFSWYEVISCICYSSNGIRNIIKNSLMTLI